MPLSYVALKTVSQQEHEQNLLSTNLLTRKFIKMSVGCKECLEHTLHKPAKNTTEQKYEQLEALLEIRTQSYKETVKRF
jgi:hypothetical protein